jgi:hypothetical protein
MSKNLHLENTSEIDLKLTFFEQKCRNGIFTSMPITNSSPKTPERLLDVIMGMSSDFQSNISLPRTLKLQKIFFQTLYYFPKHSLINLEDFGKLFQKHGIILDISKHFFACDKYDQQLSNEFIPKSFKDFLNDWYYNSPFWNMLEGKPWAVLNLMKKKQFLIVFLVSIQIIT